MAKKLAIFISLMLIGQFSMAATVPTTDCNPKLAALDHGGTAIDFRGEIGKSKNIFFGKDNIRRHIEIVSAGPSERPYFVIAGPEGNHGAAIFGEPVPRATKIKITGSVQPMMKSGEHGIAMSFEISKPTFKIEEFVLGSNRVIRDVEHGQILSKDLKPVVAFTDSRHFEVTRQSYKNYTLIFKAEDDTYFTEINGKVTMHSLKGVIRYRIESLTDEKTLTPKALNKIFTKEALENLDPLDLQMFAFLFYNEKMLAGSWRYMTYFGRDTLTIYRLMMSILTPEAQEILLGSVLERIKMEDKTLSGDVAHEEDIGDFAFSQRIKDGKNNNNPYYDYKMVDDDFLLVVCMAEYIKSNSPLRVTAFLDRVSSRGYTYREAFKSNLDLVMSKSEKFAQAPIYENLIGFKFNEKTKKYEMTGDWHDSDPGNGGGRYPGYVNTALVPAALEGAVMMYESKSAGFYNQDLANQGRSQLKVWRENVNKNFIVHVPREEALIRAGNYAQHIGLKINLSEPIDSEIKFFALSLKDDGRPVEVMNSDGGFHTLFDNPSNEIIQMICDSVINEFPLGLRTPYGILIANPALGAPDDWNNFTSEHYHGLVVWPSQEFILAEGLKRQYERKDLTDLKTKEKLFSALVSVWEVLLKNQDFQNQEVYAVTVQSGKLIRIPYGQAAGAHTKSNFNQGWSNVHMAVTPPPYILKWLQSRNLIQGEYQIKGASYL